MSRVSPTPTTPTEMDFYAGLKQILAGHALTRVAWHDDRWRVFLSDGLLKIQRSDSTWHAWTICDADLLATDWVVVPDGNNPPSI